MATTLTPKELLEQVLHAIDESGWRSLILDMRKPFRLRLFRSDKFIGALFLLACSTAHAGFESLNPLSWFTPKDASNYATKMAATIKDTPACQRFKDEIMTHAKGSPTNGKTVGPIGEAKRKATEAGCAK